MQHKLILLLSLTSTLSAGAFSPTPASRRNFLENVFSAGGAAAAASLVSSTGLPQPALADDITIGGKIQFGADDIMAPKAHGTSNVPVQQNLRYGVSNKLADKICNFNRHFAEYSGSFKETNFEEVVRAANGPVTFYDSNSGKPLFVAPIGRSVEEFIEESEYHGWPSFRDQEVVWDNVRVLKSSGETVSVDGTHLGHNIPSRDKRNRYCINLVSVAGNPV
jgi:peptide methionine sulfoxide reductase MsrB